MLIRAVGNHINQLRFQGTDTQSKKNEPAGQTQPATGQDRFESSSSTSGQSGAEYRAADSEKLQAQKETQSALEHYMEKKRKGHRPSPLSHSFGPNG